MKSNTQEIIREKIEKILEEHGFYHEDGSNDSVCINQLLSLISLSKQETLKEVEKEIMSYQMHGYDFDGDRFYDLLKFIKKLTGGKGGV